MEGLRFARCRIENRETPYVSTLEVPFHFVLTVNSLLCNQESALPPAVFEVNKAIQGHSNPSDETTLFDETWARPPETSKRSNTSVAIGPAGDKQQERFPVQAASYSASRPEGEASAASSNVSNVVNNSICDITLLGDGCTLSPTGRSADPEISEEPSYPETADFSIDDDELVMFSPLGSELAAISAQGPSRDGSEFRAENASPPNSGAAESGGGTVRSKRPQVSDQESLAALVNSYIVAENERCVNHGVPGPQNTFLADKVMNELNDLESKDMETFLQISVGICSPEAVVALREAVRRSRAEQGAELPSPSKNLSAKERMSVIENVEQKLTHLTLFKRCHILRLCDEHCGATAHRNGWVMLDMQQTFRSKRPKRAGNPLNLEESRATKELLMEMYPHLDGKSLDYKRKYNMVRKIRRLGQRLYILRERFGKGILGLIQCSELDSTGYLPVNITDQM